MCISFAVVLLRRPRSWPIPPRRGSWNRSSAAVLFLSGSVLSTSPWITWLRWASSLPLISNFRWSTWRIVPPPHFLFWLKLNYFLFFILTNTSNWAGATAATTTTAAWGFNASVDSFMFLNQHFKFSLQFVGLFLIATVIVTWWWRRAHIFYCVAFAVSICDCSWFRKTFKYWFMGKLWVLKNLSAARSV